MKFTVVVVCIVVLATFADGLSIMEMLTAVRECKQQHNCKENITEELLKSNVPKTREGLETMYCFCEKVGMISDNKINPEIMTEILEKMNIPQPAKITAACQTQCTGVDHAEAVKAMLYCIKDETKKN